MIRLFVALPLPTDQCQRLRALCGGVRDARWTEEANLHMTLQFIGEVPEPEVDEITAALSSVEAESFDLTLSGVGHFGSHRKIRSLWAGIISSPALYRLQKRIENVLIRKGIAPDTRKFSPHITLARLKYARPLHVRDWLEVNSYFRGPSFKVDSFTLFHSYRGHTGAIYSPLENFLLRQEATV